MRTIALTYTPYVHRAATLFAAVIVCSLLMYGIFLLEAVSSTAKRAHAEREIKALTSELSTMQSQFLSYTREVSPERATSLGFVTPSEVSTVFAATPRPLSLVGH